MEKIRQKIALLLRQDFSKDRIGKTERNRKYVGGDRIANGGTEDSGTLNITPEIKTARKDAENETGNNTGIGS